MPAGEAGFAFDGPLGPVTGRPDLYGPLAEPLGAGPAPFADLLRLVPFAAAGRAALVEALALMVHAGRAAPVMRPAAARRFNRVAVERAGRGTFHAHLASPATRAGVAVEDLELLLLGRGPAPLDDLAAARIVGAFRRGNRPHPYAAMGIDDLRDAQVSFRKHALPLLGSLSVSSQG